VGFRWSFAFFLVSGHRGGASQKALAIHAFRENVNEDFFVIARTFWDLRILEWNFILSKQIFPEKE
jgi:hypothetical protein